MTLFNITLTVRNKLNFAQKARECINKLKSIIFKFEKNQYAEKIKSLYLIIFVETSIYFF